MNIPFEKCYNLDSRNMIVKEIEAKSVLTKSRIEGVPYCLNPYVGCQHGCAYCYARFMKKFSGHTEPWGNFVDVKINAPQVLEKQLNKAKKECVSISTVTDPYQPLEKKYGITRKCLEILLQHEFPVSILTKSPLVLRDIDLLCSFPDVEVGITITTDNDEIRRIFEPRVPTIAQRLETLKGLHEKGISTYVFIGPILPMNPDELASLIIPYANRILIDKLNYSYLVEKIYQHYKLVHALTNAYFKEVIDRLQSVFDRNGIEVTNAAE